MVDIEKVYWGIVAGMLVLSITSIGMLYACSMDGAKSALLFGMFSLLSMGYVLVCTRIVRWVEQRWGGDQC